MFYSHVEEMSSWEGIDLFYWISFVLVYIRIIFDGGWFLCSLMFLLMLSTMRETETREHELGSCIIKWYIVRFEGRLSEKETFLGQDKALKGQCNDF